MPLNKLYKYIKKAKIISFDIFDTLLLRPYTNPSDVFLELELMYSVPGFAGARYNAEPKGWQNLVNENKDDVTLDEIYKYMPKEFQSMKQNEIDFEAAHLYANPEMIDVLNYVLSLNKQIIIVSDMYLPHDVLKEILVRELKTDNFKLYVSCEYGKRKHTGKLFQHVLQDLRCDASDILHIGDNEKSDYEIPKKYGINAFHYICPIQKFLSDNRVSEFLRLHNDLFGHRFIGTLSLMLELYNHDNTKDYWQKLAFLYGGALGYNYVKMITEKSEAEKLDNLCFVARDGYSLEKIFKVLNPESKISTKYVYAPRFTNTLAYIDLGNKYVLQERKDVLLNFLINQGIAKSGDNIEIHMDELQKYADIERDEYKKYISNLNLGEYIGIVDSISMTYSAQKLIMKNVPDKKTLGFYWWTIPVNGQSVPKLYQFYNGRRGPVFNDLIEFFFAAPEKPIHRVIDGRPVYKEYIDKYEQIKIDLYPKISKAMIDFAEIAKQYKLNPSINDEAMFDWLNLFVRLADEKDYKQFKDIKNSIDQSHTKYKSVLPEFAKPDVRKNRREIRHIVYKKTKSDDGTIQIYIFGIRIIKYRRNILKTENTLKMLSEQIKTLQEYCKEKDLSKDINRFVKVSVDEQDNAVFLSNLQGTNETPIKLVNNAYCLFKNIVFPGTVIGRYSYIGEYTKIDKDVVIGRYCSIANNVLIGATIHPQHWLSSSPFQYDNWLDSDSKKKSWEISKKTVIENDVWIGSGVVIKSGVTVHNGAIIGSGAVVTHDVPPYAVVAGVPARIIRYRFEPDIVQKLLEVKWWNLPHEQIRNLPFNDINECLKELRKKVFFSKKYIIMIKQSIPIGEISKSARELHTLHNPV